MENECELSYETLTRVYLRLNKHYKSVGAGVKLLEPGFELDDQEWVEMGSFLFRRKWGLSYNERFMALSIHEMDLEAKVSYEIWLGYVGGLEYDVEGLLDVFLSYKVSLMCWFVHVLLRLRKEEKGNHVQVLFKKVKKIFRRGTCKHLKIVWFLSRRTMSSPNPLTSNTEDAFSEYVSVVPDYSPASPGKTYSSTSNNSTDWNAYAQPIGIEQANGLTWSELKRLLTNKYSPRTEIKKMEDEFYNLSVKGNDLKTYVRRFQELVVLCTNMVPNNEKLMEVFIGELPRSIKGNVTASKLQSLEEAINIAQRTLHNQVSSLQQGRSSDQELQKQRTSYWK
nr:reverse transcriptase domain-containing protein [Tanacetum cinerariifolium]